MYTYERERERGKEKKQNLRAYIYIYIYPRDLVNILRFENTYIPIIYIYTYICIYQYSRLTNQRYHIT